MRLSSFRAVDTRHHYLHADHSSGSSLRGRQQPARASLRHSNNHSKLRRNRAAPSTSQGSIAVAVHNVSVDAIVTDDNGAYMRDLKKENFRILEDGKPQEIVSFSQGRRADHAW